MSLEVPRIVLITSGDGGSTAEAFVHATQAGYVDARVAAVIYNNSQELLAHPQNHIVARVERLNLQYESHGAHPGQPIQLHKINNTTHPGGPAESKAMITDEASEAMHEVFQRVGASLGMLLGYRKLLRGPMQTEWAAQRRLTNNHPGRVDVPQLKGLWGMDVHRKAHALRQQGIIDHTGVVVQLVAPKYDEGSVIEMVPVPIAPTDTPEDIYANVQLVEKMHTPRIIGRHLLGLAGQP